MSERAQDKQLEATIAALEREEADYQRAIRTARKHLQGIQDTLAAYRREAARGQNAQASPPSRALRGQGGLESAHWQPARGPREEPEGKLCLRCGTLFRPTKRMPDHCSYRCYRMAGSAAQVPDGPAPSAIRQAEEFAKLVEASTGPPEPEPPPEVANQQGKGRAGRFRDENNSIYTDMGCALHPSCLECPFPVCFEDYQGGQASFLATYGHLSKA